MDVSSVNGLLTRPSFYYKREQIQQFLPDVTKIQIVKFAMYHKKL